MRKADRSGFIALSPLFTRVVGALMELLDEFLDGEAAGARARYELGDELRELAAALDFIRLDSLLADECASPLLRLQDTANLKFAVGAHDGVRIDRKIHGNLP